MPIVLAWLVNNRSIECRIFQITIATPIGLISWPMVYIENAYLDPCAWLSHNWQEQFLTYAWAFALFHILTQRKSVFTGTDHQFIFLSHQNFVAPKFCAVLSNIRDSRKNHIIYFWILRFKCLRFRLTISFKNIASDEIRPKMYVRGSPCTIASIDTTLGVVIDTVWNSRYSHRISLSFYNRKRNKIFDNGMFEF